MGHRKRKQLDNARRLRRVYFIDPEVGEYKETIKKRHEKVGSSNGARQCLAKGNKETLGAPGNCSEQ